MFLLVCERLEDEKVQQKRQKKYFVRYSNKSLVNARFIIEVQEILVEICAQRSEIINPGQRISTRICTWPSALQPLCQLYIRKNA